MKIRQKFEMLDPYNNNWVRGFIYKSSEWYGDLLITHVNDIEYKQHIHTTPKFMYPGRVTSHYKYQRGKFPNYDKLYIFDKLDGTNICMFSYRDADGTVYRSYKTRLVPFLREAGYSNWIDLWGRCIKKYPFIKELEKVTDYNFGFEMYGCINLITILYEEDLAVKLLYGLNSMGTLQIPTMFLEDEYIPKYFVSSEEADDAYTSMRSLMDLANTDKLLKEGVMMYGIRKEKVVFAYKCKPDTILQNIKIEMGKIGFKEIYNTSINATESMSGDDCYAETIVLLLEEYPEEMVYRHVNKIRSASTKALIYVKFRFKVISWWKEQKVEVFVAKEHMPTAMKHFKGQKSTAVYQIINALYG